MKKKMNLKEQSGRFPTPELNNTVVSNMIYQKLFKITNSAKFCRKFCKSRFPIQTIS